MKDFPRLFSLTTLGIRQHQEFDYNFHPFRTDFVGDSGCGKSMIADLVQLVFVGSEVFHSATEAMDKRPVDGMVLRSQGRSSDIAYILINVEVSQGNYLVIGAYLESTSRHTKSFIIQSDWNEDSLTPLKKTVTVEDIFVDNQIPTIEMFQRSLEEKGMVYHYFAQRKKFHQYLYKHKLLSIDLSQSHQVLKDYALIIQSFSRGKSLDISNSESLKSFLFGDEKAKQITEKYKRAVDDLQVTLKEYTQNRIEIEIVKKKHQALKTLRSHRTQLEQTQEVWLLKLCAYTEQEELEALDSFKDSSKDYREGFYNLTALKDILNTELGAEEINLRQLQKVADEAQECYNNQQSLFSKLKPFKELLTKYDCDIEDLKGIYDKYQTDSRHAEVINSINLALQKEKISDFQAQYSVHTKLDSLIATIDQQLEETKSILRQKEDLIAFAGLSDEGSLGYWAIQNYKPYSREIEAILMHYKNLPLKEPIDDGVLQYVPKPDQLLNDDTIVDRRDTGFWIKTGEIRQYITYPKSQLFVTQTADQLKNILESFSADLEAEITALKNRLQQLNTFKTFSLNTTGFAEFLRVQQHAEELREFRPIASLNIPLSDFEEGLSLLLKREEIDSDFQNANEAWRTSQGGLGNYNRLIAALKKADEQIKNIVSVDTFDEVLSIITNAFPDLIVEEREAQKLKEYQSSTFHKAADKETWIGKIVTDNLQKISLIDINRQLEEYESLKKAKEEAFKEARLSLAKEPDITPWKQISLVHPAAEEKAYISAKSIYDTKFADIVAEYASGEAYKFETSQNYIELCEAVLPEAFLEEKIEQDTSIELIEHYLSQINEKNKNLNTRKLQKIREILDEVGDEIGKRLDTVRQIHNFLNHEEREITGGHRVSLRHDTANSYPKAWIDAYVEKLEQENTLFAIGETLNELLKDSVSLEEKMINAFHTFGGHKSNKPKIEELLNPNSYFSLNFKMESHATGKTNSGSTGQTYAAIALLCIARLSLVNKSSFNKKPPEGIRFMPVDEAEGLGSNFDMLYDIAKEFDYQILTMSINPLGKFKEGEQYIYMLSNNKEAAEDINYPPFGVFSDADQDKSL